MAYGRGGFLAINEQLRDLRLLEGLWYSGKASWKLVGIVVGRRSAERARGPHAADIESPGVRRPRPRSREFRGSSPGPPSR